MSPNLCDHFDTYEPVLRTPLLRTPCAVTMAPVFSDAAAFALYSFFLNVPSECILPFFNRIYRYCLMDENCGCTVFRTRNVLVSL